MLRITLSAWLLAATLATAQETPAPTKPAPASSEKSVKPGINDRFRDPSLDVSEWLGRFEVESREVYGARERAVVDVFKDGRRVRYLLAAN